MKNHFLTLDALIILGARLNDHGRPGRIARMRVEHALRLWQAGGAGCRFLVTGGYSREDLAVSEARAMAEHALDLAESLWGPECRERLENCLVLEEASRTTWDSAQHTLPLVLDLGLGAVGLVSDSLHLRRAHFLFRRHFQAYSVVLQPFPVPRIWRHYWQNRRYLWLTKMVLRESAAWLKVLARLSRPGQTGNPT